MQSRDEKSGTQMKRKKTSAQRNFNSVKKSQQTAPPKESQNGLLIVAIGASAGGIEAITDLLRNLPSDTGMAFVLIQHLDPTHHSILTELVSKETSMHVREVEDGLPLQPNHVYV